MLPVTLAMVLLVLLVLLVHSVYAGGSVDTGSSVGFNDSCGTAADVSSDVCRCHW